MTTKNTPPDDGRVLQGSSSNLNMRRVEALFARKEWQDWLQAVQEAIGREYPGATDDEIDKIAAERISAHMRQKLEE